MCGVGEVRHMWRQLLVHLRDGMQPGDALIAARPLPGGCWKH